MKTIFTCILVDDELHGLENIRQFVKNISQLKVLSATQNPFEAQALAQTDEVDLLITDLFGM